MKTVMRAAAFNSACYLFLLFGLPGLYWATRTTMFYGAFHGWWPLQMR